MEDTSSFHMMFFPATNYNWLSLICASRTFASTNFQTK
jgi:hypothetical protein